MSRTIHSPKPYQQCRSLDGWQIIRIHSETESLVYKVFVNPWRESSENICECKGYTYNGHCKHQEKASQRICGWHEIDGVGQTDSQRKYNICPACGGPTMWVLQNE